MPGHFAFACAIFRADHNDADDARERATRAPSAHRLRRARAAGQVAVSRPLVHAAATSAGVAALLASGATAVYHAQEFLRSGLQWAGELAADTQTIASPMPLSARSNSVFLALLDTCLPIVLISVAAGVLCGCVQSGFLWAPGVLKPRWRRISWRSPRRRVWSARTGIEFARFALAIAGLSLVVWTVFRQHAPDLMHLPGATGSEIATALARVLTDMLLGSVSVLLVIGVLDWCAQRVAYRRSLMMTRAEARREHRELVGHPLTRARLKRQLNRHRTVYPDGVLRVVVTTGDVAVLLGYRLWPSGRSGGRSSEQPGEQPDEQPWLARCERGQAAYELIAQARIRDILVVRDIALGEALAKLVPGTRLPVALQPPVAAVLAGSLHHSAYQRDAGRAW